MTVAHSGKSKRVSISRRRFLRMAAGAGAAGLSGASLWTRAAHAAGPAAQQTPVVVVQTGEPSTLDWQMGADKNTHEIGRQIFDTILQRNPKTLNVEGNLAESWRLLNNTAWQFKLRRGVKFHNGELFDANAVKFSIERMLNPKQGAPGRASIDLLDHVDIIDPFTVNIVTKKPFPLLPVRLTSGMLGTIPIVPPQYVVQVGDAGFAAKPVGTGAYKFVEWVRDDHVTLDANPDYHFGPPAIKRLVFRPVPELTTRVAALLSGQADLISDIPPEQIPRVKASGAARVEVSTLGTFIIMICMTNYLMPGPWEDVRVRRAINYAVDMDTIMKTVLGGYGRVVGLPLEEQAFGFDPNIKWYGYNPAQAKALLSQAGYPNGFEMTLHVPNHRYINDVEVMQAIASMLGGIGIRAQVKVWEQALYATKWNQRALLPAFMVAWGGGGLFDGDLLVNSVDSHSAISIYKNAMLDHLLEEARSNLDPQKRKALYWKAQELIYDEAPVIKTYQQAAVFGISNRLDWHPHIDNILRFHDAKLR